MLKDCHDCGAKPGEVHSDGCDTQRCTVCFGPRIEMLSKRAKAVICAYERGYSVNHAGDIFSPSGNKLRLTAYNGYKRFHIRDNGTRYHVLAHRLVAFFKYGIRALCPKVQTRHLNGNRGDNSWANISIGTQSDNMMDKPASDRLRIARNANASRRKLTGKDVEAIRKQKSVGASYKQLAGEYHVSPKVIWNIVKRKTYK
jgi:hypothetical protein